MLLSMGFVTRAKRIEDCDPRRSSAAANAAVPLHHRRGMAAGRGRSADLVTRLGLQDRVTVLGYVTDEEFSALLAPPIWW